MGKKKFEQLLFKNTLALAVPAILVLAVLMFMFIKYPVLEQTRLVNISEEDLYKRVSELYRLGDTNVKLTKTGDLTYAGFNYYVNGKVKGGYYYQLNEDRIMFYIIETKNPPMKIDSKSIKARIVKDSISTEYIVNQLVEAGGFEGQLKDDFFSEYVISECDYPVTYITMLYILFASPIVISVLIIAYTLLVWANPSLHGQSKQLSHYGDIGAVIEELNLQLTNHMIYKLGNIYVTEDYLIVSYLVKTDVIKLDKIKEIEKAEVEKHTLPWKKQRVFKLRFFTELKTEYELELLNEDTLNDIIDYVSVMH
ncbi:MAG: hypothetical protein IJ224_02565 [Lachnospiraceae bacterium]|nr:hypothetical protein [Lachnospiraceae bacterium]